HRGQEAVTEGSRDGPARGSAATLGAPLFLRRWPLELTLHPPTSSGPSPRGNPPLPTADGC
ncbi:MAG: hypothetical protein ACREQ5_36530, partial [Candidatus Dormibacteria bacterium]